jgi:4-hydroxy-tetrahydrodipicolinate synthase
MFSGSFVALITPFDRKGRLDRKALEKLVEWHIAEGTDGLVCSATTGEGPTLSDADRKNIAEICIRTSAGRIAIIVATGINDTHTSIRHTEKALALGANGCLVVTPYYNKPTQRGCILHFREVAKVSLPVIIYHNPPRAVIRLTIETVREISQIPNVVAFKDSSHDIEFVRQIAPLIPVFAGDDDITFDILQAGGVGAIAPIANVIPRTWKHLIQLCRQKEWDQARLLFQKYLPLIRSLYTEVNPQCFKFLLSWLNQCQPVLRLPLLLPTEATQSEIKKQFLRLSLPQLSTRHIINN